MRTSIFPSTILQKVKNLADGGTFIIPLPSLHPPLGKSEVIQARGRAVEGVLHGTISEVTTRLTRMIVIGVVRPEW